MNIDYNLYKIFLYLFEEKSISKTASKLYVSQPAISYSLKELENQLGYTLFNRNSKGIEPTNEAIELYRYVSTAFNILKDGEEYIQNLNNLNVGNVKIGVSNILGSIYIAKIVSMFRELYPGIKFEILNGSTSELVDMLHTKKIDIALDILPINSNFDVSREALVSFDNSFVYSKNKFMNVNIDDIGDLKNYNLLLPATGSSLRIKLDEYLNNRNTALESVIEVSNIGNMLELVKNGVGIGYLPTQIINKYDDLECINILDLPKTDLCFIYYDGNFNAAVKKIVDFLVENHNILD